MTGSKLGHFELLDKIGEGGMGAVFLAENVDIGRNVAIKVLRTEVADDPQILARFKQEARAAAAIGHPGRSERRFKPAPSSRVRGTDLPTMVRQIVRLGIQTLPEGALHDRLVGDIERELIGQVMCDCEQVQVKAAQRLGINRNTLHKKLAEFEAAEGDGQSGG